MHADGTQPQCLTDGIPNSDLDGARPKFQVVKPWKNEIGSVAFHVISMNLVAMFGARPNAHND
jgi:hypothetical protein